MSDPRRQLLLEIYAAAAADTEPVPAAVSMARRFELATSSFPQLPPDSAERVAICVAHNLHIGGDELQVWVSELLPCGRDAPAQRLALTAARLFAGRDEMLLLAAALRGRDGTSARSGALIDGETCARIALAGLDLESELACANCSGALEAAGDLLPAPSSAAFATAAPLYLVLGLKLPLAATATRLSARGGSARPML